MLHLLPIKWILVGFALYCGAVTLWATHYGTSNDVSVHDLWFLGKTLVGAPTVLIVVLYMLWRFVKPIQMLVFPKLGGEWDGHISYLVGERTVQKNARLFVKHSFSGVVLVLESEESTSQTLVVSPQRDDTGTQFKLYYVFENQRKPKYCVAGRPTKYREVAIIEFDRGLQNLTGQYFTEQNTQGKIDFNLVKPSWL